MDFVELKGISRPDSPIMYRRAFTAVACVHRSDGRVEEIPVSFVLEHNALGAVSISLDLNGADDATVATVRDRIRQLESEGGLP